MIVQAQAQEVPAAQPAYLTWEYWQQFRAGRAKWPKSVDAWLAANPGRAAGRAVGKWHVRYFWRHRRELARDHFRAFVTADRCWQPLRGVEEELTPEQYHILTGTTWTPPAVMPTWQGGANGNGKPKAAKRPKAKPVNGELAPEMVLIAAYGDYCRLMVGARIMPRSFDTWTASRR